MQNTGFLRYRADRRSVLTVVAIVAASLMPFLLEFPPLLLAPYWLAVLYLHTYAPYIQHNQGHLPAFRTKPLNWAYDILLAQCTGYPTALWELQHVRGHHRHFLTPEKDVAAITHPVTGRLMSRTWYVLHGNLTILRDSIRIGREEARQGQKSFLPKLAFELAVQAAITFGLFYWNPWMAVAFFVVPCLSMSAAIWWESYQHHLGLPMDTMYDASVTILDPEFNHLTFNIGHHSAHHEKPTLHWSLLPQRTAAIRARLAPECVQERYHFFARKPARNPAGAEALAAASRLAEAPETSFHEAMLPG